MDRLHQHLRGLNPRADLRENFYPDQVETYKPALLNAMPLLSATAVATRVLEVVARRGGTRIKPSALERLRQILEHVLPHEVIAHCDDEAQRVLRWLEGEAETIEAGSAVEGSETPELDMMFAADLESRISVVEFALREEFDLELEYYDASEEVWPRLRATPLALRTQEGTDEPAETELVVDAALAEPLVIPVRSLRWLMPVSRRARPEQPRPPSRGKVLEFPSRRE